MTYGGNSRPKARLVVPKLVLIEIQDSRVLTACRLVNRYRRCEGAYCRDGAEPFSETSVNIYQLTQRNVEDDFDFHAFLEHSVLSSEKAM
jgi:hypothetical protein